MIARNLGSRMELLNLSNNINIISISLLTFEYFIFINSAQYRMTNVRKYTTILIYLLQNLYTISIQTWGYDLSQMCVLGWQLPSWWSRHSIIIETLRVWTRVIMYIQVLLGPGFHILRLELLNGLFLFRTPSFTSSNTFLISFLYVIVTLY